MVSQLLSPCVPGHVCPCVNLNKRGFTAVGYRMSSVSAQRVSHASAPLHTSTLERAEWLKSTFINWLPFIARCPQAGDSASCFTGTLKLPVWCVNLELPKLWNLTELHQEQFSVLPCLRGGAVCPPSAEGGSLRRSFSPLAHVWFV